MQVESFDVLYEEYVGLVLNYLLRALGDREDAEDATVETFRRVYHGLPRFRGECAAKVWVMRIASNVAIRTRNDRARRRAAEGADPQPVRVPSGDVATRAANRDLVERLLSNLPDQQRHAVWLRVGLEQTDNEVAEILQVPVGTVKSWVWRALVRLRRELGEQESGEVSP